MNTKTMAIKSRLANSLRTRVYKDVSRKPALTTDQKIAMFDDWLLQIWDMHSELNAYKKTRRRKAKVQAERLARGYKSKKKTSLEEYKKNLVNS